MKKSFIKELIILNLVIISIHLIFALINKRVDWIGNIIFLFVYNLIYILFSKRRRNKES